MLDNETNSNLDRHTRRRVLMAIGGGIAMGSTASVGATTAQQTNEEDTQESAVRVVHLAPDVPTVDVYVNGDLGFEEVDPFATETGYLDYVPGTYPVAFTPTGEELDGAVFETEVTLETGDYTLAAIGEVCSLTDRPFELVSLEDDNSEPATGETRIRIMHASPDAPTLTVTTEAGATIGEDIAFGETATADLSAGAGIIVVQDADSEESLARFEVTAEAGHVYTGFIVGYLSPEDAPQDAADDASFGLALTEDAAPAE